MACASVIPGDMSQVVEETFHGTPDVKPYEAQGVMGRKQRLSHEFYKAKEPLLNMWHKHVHQVWKASTRVPCLVDEMYWKSNPVTLWELRANIARFFSRMPSYYASSLQIAEYRVVFSFERWADRKDSEAYDKVRSQMCLVALDKGNMLPQCQAL